MKRIKTKSLLVMCCAYMMSSLGFAAPFGFDRPGEGMGTAVVPKARLAWEQSLPSASYDEFYENGTKNSVLSLQSDVLLRLGVGADTELRLGWDGAVWERHKQAGIATENDGVGDVSVGIKRAINTHDEDFSWAVLAQVNLANGDDDFTVEKKIYTLGSAVDYQWNDVISTNMSMYYDWQDGDLAWSAIPGLQYQISDNVSGFAEYIYRKQESQKSESVVNNGVLWSISDRLQADVSIGYSFTEAQPKYLAGMGITYLF